MKINVNITLTDRSSEEEMVARGVTREKILALYTRGFQNLLENIRTKGVETDLHVVIVDNTKEDAIEALKKQIPTEPIEEADDFGERSLCCPNCIGPVTNYWAPGTKPKHCQFCGQALKWEE